MASLSYLYMVRNNVRPGATRYDPAESVYALYDRQRRFWLATDLTMEEAVELLIEQGATRGQIQVIMGGAILDLAPADATIADIYKRLRWALNQQEITC